MTTLEQRITETLAAHMDGKRTFEGVATDHEHLITVRCPCGWFEANVPFRKVSPVIVWQAHVSEALTAALAPAIREAQAEALREAADELAPKGILWRGDSGVRVSDEPFGMPQGSLDDWLRARADNLEAPDASNP